jgi:F-type H+-transporting ATPase subunit b
LNPTLLILSLVSNAHAASLSSGGAIDVDLDLTVFVQVGIFVVMMLVLKPLLFDPMLKLFEEREKRIEGARAKALETDRISGQAQADYEEAMRKMRVTAGAERDKLRAEGVRQETEILNVARADVTKALEASRTNVSAEKASVSAALQTEAKDLGRSLAARVLGRELA